MSLGCACSSGSCANGLRSPHQRRILESGRALLLGARLFRANVCDLLLGYDLLREVCSVVLVSACDRASTRPFVDARGALTRPRSGDNRPTPIKSIRSSCGAPSRSIISRTPGRDDQVHGTIRAGREPQGFARQGGKSTPSQSREDAPFSGRGCYTCVTWAEDRATVGTDPSAAPGLEEE